ncbi:MAG: PEP-utilizing enzyme [Patescibacteria group bacterium]|jgi:phosphohistidine swiveling domain-containing protein
MSKKFTLFTEDYNVPPHPWLLWNKTFYDLRLKTKGKIFIDSIFIFQEGKALWAPDASQFSAAGAYFLPRLQADSTLAEEIVRQHYIGFAKIKRFVSSLKHKDLKKMSPRGLSKIYDDFCRIWLEIADWSAIPQYVDMGDNKYSVFVEKNIRGSLSAFGDPGVIFSRLLTPLKATYVRREAEAALGLLARWQRQPKLWRAFKRASKLANLDNISQRRQLQSLSRRFGWLQYYYDGQAAGPEYYFELLKGRAGDKAGKILSANKREREKLGAWQKRIESSLSVSARHDIRLLREFSFIKELRKEMQIYYLNYAMSSWFTELGRRLFCSQTQAKYLTPEEIRGFLRSGRRPRAEELPERFHLSAFVTIKGKSRVLVGKEAESMVRYMQMPKLIKTNVDIFTGQVSFPGRVRGAVKIINAVADIKKFNKGDILVSFSTNPSLVPAMNRASAIITDAGGVTCHAAIVSREMKIPCIIGTKIATRILKDGDIVEVDARKGIVKVIKRIR